jgi:hypothetical protein
VLILVTLSMVCAVFSPVWVEWRQGVRDRTPESVEDSILIG